MGQKVSPHGLRVGVIKDWDSKWYANKKDFADYLVEDKKIRELVKRELYAAGISKVLIERAADDKVKVTVLTAKPGMVIGRSGTGIDEIKAKIKKLTGRDVDISIIEVRRSEMDSQLTAESIAQALEKRVSFRRAMKQAIGRTMKSGAKGIKVLVSGRLGGAEIARSEKYSEGNVPLHTLRANIDYGFAEADTTYGKLGVKVWINHGEILEKELKSPLPEEKPEKGKRDGERRKRDGQRGRDGQRSRDGQRRNSRKDGGDKVEMKKAVNPRKRIAPKAEPAPAASEVEVNAPVEPVETEAE